MNGDFVDRGSYGVEVFLTLCAFRIYDPTCMHMNRGNHEARTQNLTEGFRAECMAKYDEEVLAEFEHCFDMLPLVHILNEKVLVVHGGIPCFYLSAKGDIIPLSRIEKIDRKKEVPEPTTNVVEDVIFNEILWNDPRNHNGWENNYARGGGCWVFGPDKSEEWVKENNVDLIVRSHECPKNNLGYDEQKGHRVCTVFSAPNYCGTVGNMGAYLIFNFKEKGKFDKYEVGSFKWA